MSDKLTLKTRLLDWLKRHPGFHASGDLQKLVMQYTTYTAQNVGRRLRELENEGEVEVSYRRGHAYYQARTAAQSPSLEVWFNELPTNR